MSREHLCHPIGRAQTAYSRRERQFGMADAATARARPVSRFLSLVHWHSTAGDVRMQRVGQDIEFERSHMQSDAPTGQDDAVFPFLLDSDDDAECPTASKLLNEWGLGDFLTYIPPQV